MNTFLRVLTTLGVAAVVGIIVTVVCLVIDVICTIGLGIGVLTALANLGA